MRFQVLRATVVNVRMHVQLHICISQGTVRKVGTMMNEIRNGMPATWLQGAEWRKSSASGAVGNCVEVAWLPSGWLA